MSVSREEISLPKVGLVVSEDASPTFAKSLIADSRSLSSSRRVHVVVGGCSKGCYLPGLEHGHEPTPASLSWHRDLDAHRGVRRCRRRHRERRGDAAPAQSIPVPCPSSVQVTPALNANLL